MQPTYMTPIQNTYHPGAYAENFVSHSDEPQIGEEVINNNPKCKHYESEGVVVKIDSLSKDKGKTATYKCTNIGDSWSKGDLLTKTMDQLMPIAQVGANYGACACKGGALGAATGKKATYNLKNFILTPQYLVGFAIGFMIAKRLR